ncbi:MAG: response regulator transcription factor [Chthonomonas sp.]|nr:response regulator transcription factor [Chthonomonas sp.]
MKVLLVEDEPTIVETVSLKLRREGYTVFSCPTAEEGMRIHRQVKPDLLLLDAMLPQRSGFELCRAIRKESQVPIIFLTARASDSDRVTGLEMGADDYITKPFNLAELAARVKAVLRRTNSDKPVDAVESGNLRLDPSRHEAMMDGKPLDLSPKEFQLLYFLMRYPGQVFGRDTLLDRVWGQDAFVSPRTVDVHVRWLRQRIEPDAANPVRIITIRGVGYRFTA